MEVRKLLESCKDTPSHWDTLQIPKGKPRDEFTSYLRQRGLEDRLYKVELLIRHAGTAIEDCLAAPGAFLWRFGIPVSDELKQRYEEFLEQQGSFYEEFTEILINEMVSELEHREWRSQV